ncbi:MAG TPA: hypothetical protein ENK02_09865, partial [Planctomycetes bacterium]|nr:hypothetical protein [Planctomycetota bacterium]
MNPFLETSNPSDLPLLSPHIHHIPPTARFFQPQSDLTLRTGHLPHWRQPNRTYFVTFCLHDALPKVAIQRLQRERQILRASRDATPLQDDKRIHQELDGMLMEKWYHRGAGACVLKDSRYRRIVRDALCFFHGERYDLHAWVLMPNHVHVLWTMRGGWDVG